MGDVGRTINGASTCWAYCRGMKRRALIAILVLAGLIAGPAAAAGGGEKKKGGGATFIQIPTMTATILRRDDRRGVLTVETGLDVPDATLRTRAELSQPRLRAAYAQFLQTYAATLAGGMAPNADYVARELQRQTDTVLGKPGARLLVGTIMIN